MVAEYDTPNTHFWHKDTFELKALKNQQVAGRFAAAYPARVRVPVRPPPFLPEASRPRPTQPFGQRSPSPLPTRFPAAGLCPPPPPRPLYKGAQGGEMRRQGRARTRAS